MRKLLMGLVAVLVVLAGVAFIAVSNLNGYLEDNRETLAGLASDPINGPRPHHRSSRARLFGPRPEFAKL